MGNYQWQQEFDTSRDQWQQSFDANLNQWQQQFDQSRDQWEQEFGLSQQKYQDTIAAQQKEYAYNLAMTMLAAGVMPDTNTLNSAGISAADAMSMRLAALQADSNGSSGSGGGDDPDEEELSGPITSDFYNSTGSYRYESPGVLFTDGQLNRFEFEVGMNRTDNGRQQAIKDALDEGKITEAQARELLAQFGLQVN